MLELFACIITGMLVCLFCVWLYLQGIEAGKALSEKRRPEPLFRIENPLKKEEKGKGLDETMQNFAGFNG